MEQLSREVDFEALQPWNVLLEYITHSCGTVKWNSLRLDFFIDILEYNWGIRKTGFCILELFCRNFSTSFKPLNKTI